MFHRSWRSEMTDTEARWGMGFFLVYFFLLPYVNAWVQRLVLGDRETLEAEANVIYYGIIFAACLILFRRFLKSDFGALLDWVNENTACILVGLAGAGVLYFLVGLLPFPIRDPIPEQYAQQFGAAPVPTLALILLLIPLVEEIMYRGVVFGQLREYNLPLAYVLSTAFYALAAVWRYALERGDPRYLLFSVAYLPLSLACTWCYDRGGSIWATAFLHAGINGVILFLAL